MGWHRCNISFGPIAWQCHDNPRNLAGEHKKRPQHLKVAESMRGMNRLDRRRGEEEGSAAEQLVSVSISGAFVLLPLLSLPATLDGLEGRFLLRRGLRPRRRRWRPWLLILALEEEEGEIGNQINREGDYCTCSWGIILSPETMESLFFDNASHFFT